MSDIAKKILYSASRIFRINQIKNAALADASEIIGRRGTPEQMNEWMGEMLAILTNAASQVAWLEAGDPTA